MIRLFSKEELSKILASDPHLAQIIVDKAVTFIYEDRKQIKERINTLPEGYKTVVSVWAAEGDIRNGGFYQYFGNSTAKEFHQLAVEGMRKIGAPKSASLLEEVFEIVLRSETFRREYPVVGMQKAFNEANDRKREIKIPENYDQSFFDSGEDLGELLNIYIKEYVENFYL